MTRRILLNLRQDWQRKDQVQSLISGLGLEESSEVPGKHQQMFGRSLQDVLLVDNRNVRTRCEGTELIGIDFADRIQFRRGNTAILQNNVSFGRGSQAGDPLSAGSCIMQKADQCFLALFNVQLESQIG